MRAGHQLVVSDLSPDAVKGLADEGAAASTSLQDLVSKLKAPRAVWIMVPAGGPTEQTVQTLAKDLQGDTIIDGGNSYFKDDVRRAEGLKAKGIHYVDVGTSGGVWGVERGYCLMIGGPRKRSSRLEPIFATLAPGIGTCPHPGPPNRAHRRTRLHPRRPLRRRPFCENGSQRHRIRPDAGLCRRLRHLSRTPTAKKFPKHSVTT